jgi:hypothetical protein
VSGGQFDWGGRLPKSNGGVQSCPQAGRKPAFEYNGIRAVYCDVHVEQLRKQGIVTLWSRMGAPKIIG